jgi:hypothetical protein
MLVHNLRDHSDRDGPRDHRITVELYDDDVRRVRPAAVRSDGEWVRQRIPLLDLDSLTACQDEREG